MLTRINGLHHVTSLAASAPANNAFFTRVLGLRRVKKTVNFDAPDIYHLYYGDARGTPGSVVTCFPFPGAARGRPGAGEVGTIAFAIPTGTSAVWADRLARLGVANIARDNRFDASRVLFDGPAGETCALIEADDDDRRPWTSTDLPTRMAIRGLHSVEIRLRDTGATAELLRFLGYVETGRSGNVIRFTLPQGSPARVIDLESLPGAAPAVQGAGSVHHVAIAADNRARQIEVRNALLGAGWQVTPVIDRDYFHAIYFRAPGDFLFEVATNEPGFDRHEHPDNLGQALRLPSRHEHLRAQLERHLEPLAD